MFNARGWEVGVTDVDAVAVAKVAGELGNAWSAVLNVTDAGACARAAAEFAGARGIDALFNSAGILRTGMFRDLPLAAQTQQIRVNCDGVCNMTYAALPHMTRTGDGGRIVTMASASAVGGVPFHAVYAATKAFVFSLTEALNMELARANVRAADVSVGYVATNMTLSLGDEGRNTPLFRRGDLFAKPRDVALCVWDAVHGARADREHFYVDLATWASFSAYALCRAFGWRFAFRTTAALCLPPAESAPTARPPRETAQL